MILDDELKTNIFIQNCLYKKNEICLSKDSVISLFTLFILYKFIPKLTSYILSNISKWAINDFNEVFDNCYIREYENIEDDEDDNNVIKKIYNTLLEKFIHFIYIIKFNVLNNIIKYINCAYSVGNIICISYYKYLISKFIYLCIHRIPENFINRFFTINYFLEIDEIMYDSDVSDSDSLNSSLSSDSIIDIGNKPNDKKKIKIQKYQQMINHKYKIENNTPDIYIHKILYYSYNKKQIDSDILDDMCLDILWNVFDKNTNYCNSLSLINKTILLYNNRSMFQCDDIKKHIINYNTSRKYNYMVIIYNKCESYQTEFKLIDINNKYDVIKNKDISFGIISLI